MLLGCLVPFMLIFLLPLLGVGEGLTMLVFIILMFGCHLFMSGGHHGGHPQEKRPVERQGGDHADS
jgi:hypothetical protein